MSVPSVADIDEIAIKAALGEFDAFWLTLWGECRSEPVEGVIAVASVIRTRAKRGARLGAGYKAVCLKPKQFSCWNPGTDANHVRLMQMAEKVAADYSVRSTLVYDEVTRQIQYIAQGIMGGQILDRVKGADHYLTTDLFLKKPPAWARGQTPVCHVGAHSFLRVG